MNDILPTGPLARLLSERAIAALETTPDMPAFEELRRRGLAHRTPLAFLKGWCYEPTPKALRGETEPPSLSPSAKTALEFLERTGPVDSDRLQLDTLRELETLANRGLILSVERRGITQFAAREEPRPGQTLGGCPIERLDGTSPVTEIIERRRQAELVLLSRIAEECR